MKLPPAQPLKSIVLDYQLGVDYTNTESNMNEHRSPYAPNMIRVARGKNEKRTGYELIKTYPVRINGVHFLGDKKIVHSGTNIYLDNGTSNYLDDTVLYSDANDEISKAIQSKKKLYIFDGKKLLVFDGTAIVTAESIAYVPTILISRLPTGGGVSLEPVNLLQPKRLVQFLGDGTAKVYQLPSTDITSVDEVKSLQADGTFTTLTQGTDYTVNLSLGQVTFTAAKPTPSGGKDNIYITYSKTTAGYADRVNKCDICTTYGLGGARDRIFCSGNPDYPNYDWYSQLNDFTYFGDLWYSILGQDDAEIMGYRIVSDKLAAVKDRAADGTNVYLREGTLIDGKAAFVSAGSFQGVGAISKHSFQDLETEPMYLTNQGVYAITPSDVLGERYSQLRSYYINKELLKRNLTTAYSVVYDRFYMLAIGNEVFILDGTQTDREGNTPYSNRQYECFHWTNVPARIMWEDDGLWFGSADGNVYKFHSDKVDPNSFKDVDTPVYACWTTPYLFGDRFSMIKTFKKIALLLKAYPVTSVTIKAQIDGIWITILEDNNSAGYFDFNYLDFSNLNFNTNTTDVYIEEKIRDIKKVDKVSIRLENGKAEPFGINKIELRYTGVYK